jgi:hypothetical protein
MKISEILKSSIPVKCSRRTIETIDESLLTVEDMKETGMKKVPNYPAMIRLALHTNMIDCVCKSECFGGKNYYIVKAIDGTMFHVD